MCRGCMRWGGESVALDFLLSTHDWTKYYLVFIHSLRY